VARGQEQAVDMTHYTFLKTSPAIEAREQMAVRFVCGYSVILVLLLFTNLF
jgi:hypothetical protein